MNPEYQKLKRGSITLTVIIGIGVPLFLASVGYIFSLSQTHNNDVKEIRTDLNFKGEEISALKEAVDTIKDDNKTIKSDVKEILQRIPKK